MAQFPVASATAAQKAPIVDRVQKILSVNVGAGPCACPAFDGQTQKTGQPQGVAPTGTFPPDISRLEAEIDKLVYALYDLTSEEIAIVEGKDVN